MKKLEKVLFMTVFLIFLYCFLSASKMLSGKADSIASASLFQITFNHGTLSPEFSQDKVNYSLFVDKSETITIVPFAAYPNSQIEINDIPCQSGYECTIPLTETQPYIKVKVTAENGLQRQYTFNIIFGYAELTGLSDIKLSSGSLSPKFDTTVTSYTVNVPCDTDKLTITPTANPLTKSISVNGQPVESGNPCDIPLSEGTNIVTVSASTDFCGTKNYILIVTREELPSPVLESLKLSTGNLNPSFSKSKTYYTATVSGNINSETITAVPNNANFKIMINNHVVQNGSSYTLNLETGNNFAYITVVSSNGKTASYTVLITKNCPEEASLSDLTLSHGTLTPSFNPSITSYTLKIGEDISEIDITPFDNIETDSIKINDTAIKSEQAFHLPLLVGTNTVTITITSQSGTSKTYTLAISRKAADSPGLSSLTLSSGTLSPVFSDRIRNYSAVVDCNIDKIGIIAVARDNTQLITINNRMITGGSEYILPLSFGVNRITILVTMSNGTSKTYTLEVTRKVKTPAGLAALTINQGKLSPAFSSDVTSYSAKVDNSTSGIIVNAIPDDISAKVKISGTTTGNVSLSVGSNIITITVTSVDGSVKTYTLTIFRGYKTKITVNTKDENGNYAALVPQYLSLLGSSDNFCFKFGNNSLIVSAGTLKQFKTTENLYVTLGKISDDTIKEASDIMDDDIIAADGYDIGIKGGSAVTGSKIDAGITISISSKLKSLLKTGTPVLYYSDKITNSLQYVGGAFDLEHGSVSFTAQKTGSYIIAVRLKSPSISYAVTSDPKYTICGALKTFKVSVTRGKFSTRLHNAQLMVVTTLSSGAQDYCFIPVTHDNLQTCVTVDGRSVHSEIYLISGSFDGKIVPSTYALTQTVTD